VEKKKVLLKSNVCLAWCPLDSSTLFVGVLLIYLPITALLRHDALRHSVFALQRFGAVAHLRRVRKHFDNFGDKVHDHTRLETLLKEESFTVALADLYSIR